MEERKLHLQQLFTKEFLPSNIKAISWDFLNWFAQNSSKEEVELLRNVNTAESQHLRDHGTAYLLMLFENSTIQHLFLPGNISIAILTSACLKFCRIAGW